MTLGHPFGENSTTPAARVMGILNVTPDSFSDGGAHIDPIKAVEWAERLIRDGAAIIDVGPESTRPGSKSVEAKEQIRRAIPVITELRRRHPAVTISIDTTRAHVAKSAIDAGADMVNETSAMQDDPEMSRMVSRCGVSVVLMHRRGTSDTMQADGGPVYGDVVEEIKGFLNERVRTALDHGIRSDRIIVDPGIGFGKRTEHNLLILRNAGRFGALGSGTCPVLIGVSRKRFLGETLDIDEPRERDTASAVAATLAIQCGATLVRAHNVRRTVEALRLLATLGIGNSLEEARDQIPTSTAT